MDLLAKELNFVYEQLINAHDKVINELDESALLVDRDVYSNKYEKLTPVAEKIDVALDLIQEAIDLLKT